MHETNETQCGICASASARVLVPDVHLARVQVVLHRAEEGVGLLVLRDTSHFIETLLGLLEAQLLFLNADHAADRDTNHEDRCRCPHACSQSGQVK